MMRLSHARVAGWILGCLLPPGDLEVVLGDLEEEYVSSRRRGRAWYWSQIGRSFPSLLLLPVRRGGWLLTLAVALGACVLQAGFELLVQFGLVDVLAIEASIIPAVTGMLTLSSLAVVSYLANRMRPGAATLLAVVVLLAIVIQLIVKTEASVAYRLVPLLVSPPIAFAGGVLSLRTSRS